MKEVKIKVITNGVEQEIYLRFDGEFMPIELDNFIKEHIGGRPKDRK